MIQELLYTSDEHGGLRRGGGGYCTVLSTEGMAVNLASALEKISGYKHPFDIHDPRSARNPVNYRHVVIRVGSSVLHVLSRVADLRHEHSGRSNKLAHHVVLTKNDLVPGGPSRVLSQPGFCREDWDGKARLVPSIPTGRLPQGDLLPTPSKYWRQITGDAGWAGFVAESLLKSPDTVISVIFPLGVDTLTLVNEVFALIPRRKRWDITFSTYYTTPIPNSSCALRFVLDGISEAEQLRRDHRQNVVDLASRLGTPVETAWVTAARTGGLPFEDESAETPPPTVVDSSPDDGRRSAHAHGGSDSESGGKYELQPPGVLTAGRRTQGQRESFDFSHHDPLGKSKSANRKRRKRRVVASLAVIAALVVLFAVILLPVWYLTRHTDSVASVAPGGLKVDPAPERGGKSSMRSASASDPADEPSEVTASGEVVAASADNGVVHGATDSTSGRTELSIALNPSRNGSDVSTAESRKDPPTVTSTPAPDVVHGQQTMKLEDCVDPILPLLPDQHDNSQEKEFPVETFDSVRVAELSELPDEIRLLGLADGIADHIVGTFTLTPDLKPVGSSPNARSWAVMATQSKSVGGDSTFEVARFEATESDLRFQWRKQEPRLRQLAADTGAPGCHLLNGLRWCVLKIHTSDGDRYVRLSKPLAPVDFGLLSDVRFPDDVGALPPSEQLRMSCKCPKCPKEVKYDTNRDKSIVTINFLSEPSSVQLLRTSIQIVRDDNLRGTFTASNSVSIPSVSEFRLMFHEMPFDTPRSRDEAREELLQVQNELMRSRDDASDKVERLKKRKKALGDVKPGATPSKEDQEQRKEVAEDLENANSRYRSLQEHLKKVDELKSAGDALVGSKVRLQLSLQIQHVDEGLSLPLMTVIGDDPNP